MPSKKEASMLENVTEILSDLEKRILHVGDCL